MSTQVKVTKGEFEDALEELFAVTGWFGFTRDESIFEETDIFLDVETDKFVPLPHVMRNVDKEYIIYKKSAYFEHSSDTDGGALMERNIVKVLDDFRSEVEDEYEDDEELLDYIFDADITLLGELIVAQYAYENNFTHCYVPCAKILKEEK